MTNKKVVLFQILFLIFVAVFFDISSVKADKQLEDNNLKIKAERIINNKSVTDKNSGSSNGLFNQQDSAARKRILKENEKDLEKGKNQIFSEYYKQGKAISPKKLFNSKRAHNIKVSSKKEENNTPVVGSILGGLTAIGTGIGLSFGATRKE